MNTNKKNPTKEQIAEILKEMTEIVLSPRGRKIIAEALGKAGQMKAQLDEERLIDPKSLHEPFTI